ncbi:hypothetical protein [Ereboglobus luteus]|nr:hypothetical protein [Ereboglobus luteus]
MPMYSMNSGLAKTLAIIAVVCIISFSAIYMIVAALLLRKRRAKFSSTREPLSDRAFLSQVGAPVAHEVYVIAARNALANVFKVPAQTLHPSDVPDDLARNFLYDGWDNADISMELEICSGMATDEHIPRFLSGRFFLFRWDGPATIGEWTRRAAAYLEKRAEKTK